jgi:hypothetical protein
MGDHLLIPFLRILLFYSTAVDYYITFFFLFRYIPFCLIVFIKSVFEHGTGTNLSHYSVPFIKNKNHALERLDQGHLHPKLEARRLTCLGRESIPASVVGGEHSSKELFEQRINSYCGTSMYEPATMPYIVLFLPCHTRTSLHPIQCPFDNTLVLLVGITNQQLRWFAH